MWVVHAPGFTMDCGLDTIFAPRHTKISHRTRMTDPVPSSARTTRRSTRNKHRDSTAQASARYPPYEPNKLPEEIAVHEDLRRISIGLARDGSGRIITMDVVERGAIFWKRYFFDRGGREYLESPVGTLYPGLYPENLLAAWQSMFGKVQAEAPMSDDPSFDNHQTKRIPIAGTRDIPSRDIWASWQIKLFPDNQSLPELTFWANDQGDEKIEDVDDKIDLTTLRRGIKVPDLWKSIIIETIARKWNLDEPPSFCQSTPEPDMRVLETPEEVRPTMAESRSTKEDSPPVHDPAASEPHRSPLRNPAYEFDDQSAENTTTPCNVRSTGDDGSHVPWPESDISDTIIHGFLYPDETDDGYRKLDASEILILKMERESRTGSQTT
jgi:hypothetical protein